MSTTLTRDHRINTAIDGVKLHTTLPLYFWLYPKPSYTLAADVHIEGGGNARVKSDVPFSEATEADVAAMLAKVRLIPCKVCGTKTFDPATVETNRDGKCEKCFLAELDASLKAHQAKQAERDAKKDRQMRKKGFTHKVVAWVHPAAGDDYQIVAYFGLEPTEAEIKGLIKGKRGAQLGQYAVTKLPSESEK